MEMCGCESGWSADTFSDAQKLTRKTTDALNDSAVISISVERQQ